VPVHVSRDRNRRVAEKVGNRSDMHASLEPSHGRRVPQRMNSNALEAGGCRRQPLRHRRAQQSGAETARGVMGRTAGVRLPGQSDRGNAKTERRGLGSGVVIVVLPVPGSPLLVLTARCKTTPAEDATFREVTEMLEVLTKRLGLGECHISWRGFLPGDPQRILSASWLECARPWFGPHA
jgi:hypothetical protein